MRNDIDVALGPLTCPAVTAGETFKRHMDRAAATPSQVEMVWLLAYVSLIPHVTISMLHARGPIGRLTDSDIQCMCLSCEIHVCSLSRA